MKCLAIDISASDCTTDWVAGPGGGGSGSGSGSGSGDAQCGVAATGTFVTPSSTGWSIGVNGIPEGWSRVDA